MFSLTVCIVTTKMEVCMTCRLSSLKKVSSERKLKTLMHQNVWSELRSWSKIWYLLLIGFCKNINRCGLNPKKQVSPLVTTLYFKCKLGKLRKHIRLKEQIAEIPTFTKYKPFIFLKSLDLLSLALLMSAPQQGRNQLALGNLREGHIIPGADRIVYSLYN